PPNGTHTLSARAFDSGGRLVGADQVIVQLCNGTSVHITSPSNAQIVAGPVTINAPYTSPAQWVDVYIDGIFLKASPPSTFSWDSTKVPNGTHLITVNSFNNTQPVRNGYRVPLASDALRVNVANGPLQITS